MIPIAKPSLGWEEIEAIRRPLVSGWVAQGPEVRAFEEEFAKYVGSRYACAVSSCTSALHLALRAIGVRPGDEVITVSHSFIATANSIRFLGAIPIFIDIDPENYNMNTSYIERVVTKRTKAILCVHQMGMPCEIEKIVDISKRLGLFVVEDAACALGSEIYFKGGWERIGKPHGDIACFSFHPRKILTTGDGGMITTRKKEFDKKCRMWRNHSKVSVENLPGWESIVFHEIGYNYRMNDIQAAIGRAQMHKICNIVEERRKKAMNYISIMKKIKGIELPKEPRWARSNWQSYCIRLPRNVNQLEVIKKMSKKGIQTTGGIMCAHREPVYRKEPWSCGKQREICGCPPTHCERLKESERAQSECLIIPMYYELDIEEQKEIASSLGEALGQE